MIGIGQNGTAISEDEYNKILSVIRAKPPRVGTTDFHLREDLTWEEYEIPEVEPDSEEEVDAEEIAAAIEEALS